MVLRIVRADATTTPAVHLFNERMERGGSRWKFYAGDVPEWLPPEEGASVWREYFVLRDDETGMVRGGYALKHEQFTIKGQQVQLGWLQGPVAESAVDKTLRGLGKIMVGDALRQYPMQISWGANSIAAPSAGTVPMLLRVVKGARFLRHAPVVRSRPIMKLTADIGAATGLGGLGLALGQKVVAAFGSRSHKFTASEETEFGPWADEVWAQAAAAYDLIAVRDARTLNRVMPYGHWPHATPVKVSVGGKVVGWAAIRDRELLDDPLFGNLRAGSVIDAFSLPGFEGTVAAAATQQLERRGVDLVGACFLSPDWIKGFCGAGYYAIPDRRNVGFSAELADAGGGLENLLKKTHLALIDSDGPRLF